jgi:hypothetical protein
MKKFNYIKWITENKHGLLNEQPVPMHTYYYSYHRGIDGQCRNSGYRYKIQLGSNNQAGNTAAYQALGSPSVGDTVGFEYQNGSHAKCFVYMGLLTNYQGTVILDGYMNWDPSTLQSFADCASCKAHFDGTSQPGCPPCNSSQWGNHQNWINNWTNNNAFNSSNPNQPCSHICQKITQWTNACANAGPVQQNVLACKIAEGNNQASIHGCNC